MVYVKIINQKTGRLMGIDIVEIDYRENLQLSFSDWMKVFN